MNTEKNSLAQEHIYESIDDIPKLASNLNDKEITNEAITVDNEDVKKKSYNSLNDGQLTKTKHSFNTYRILLTLLYGALFSYTVTFILHNLELSVEKSANTVTFLWILVGFIIGCSQIFISWEIWQPWKYASKSISIVWLGQCLNFIMIMVHNVINQEEMHKYYHGLFIFFSLVSIFHLAFYGFKKVQVDQYGSNTNCLIKKLQKN